MTPRCSSIQVTLSKEQVTNRGKHLSLKSFLNLHNWIVKQLKWLVQIRFTIIINRPNFWLQLIFHQVSLATRKLFRICQRIKFKKTLNNSRKNQQEEVQEWTRVRSPTSQSRRRNSLYSWASQVNPCTLKLFRHEFIYE